VGTGGLFFRKVRAMAADEPTGFVWIEAGKLAGSGYPASRGQVEWLARTGIKSILTLTEGPLPEGYSKGLDVTTRHVAMNDHDPPSFESLNRAVEFVRGELGAGKPVLVHCLAGEGRTGCVVAAYLISTRGFGADEALTEIRRVKPAFVEGRQEVAVRDFAERLHS